MTSFKVVLNQHVAKREAISKMNLDYNTDITISTFDEFNMGVLNRDTTKLSWLVPLTKREP